MEEKRRFTRIVFSTPVQVQYDGQLYQSQLIDLSLKGALLQKIDDCPCKTDERCSLFFKLPGSDVTIEMVGNIAHKEATQIGFLCEKIDLESVSHLRRLIELNVGNDELLHRELLHLSHPDN